MSIDEDKFEDEWFEDLVKSHKKLWPDNDIDQTPCDNKKLKTDETSDNQIAI